MTVIIEEQDLLDLSTCGQYAKFMEHQKLYYSLKTRVLQRYGMFYGYCLQKWFDSDWYDGEKNYAEHRHILEIYYLSTGDGRYISKYFHIPTDQFSYYNFEYENGKTSSRFEGLLKQCRPEFEMLGKKEYVYGEEERQAALESFYRLFGKFSFLFINDLDAYLSYKDGS